METVIVLARLAQYAAAMVLCGSPLFFLYGPPPPQGRWPRLLMGAMAILGVVGVVAWLMAQAALFGDRAADAFDVLKVWSVAADTGVGRASLVRIALFVAAFAASRLTSEERSTWLTPAALGGVVAGSLAWLGHGRTGDGALATIHLLSDIAHLVAAGVWLGALVPLLVLVLRYAGSELEAERLDVHAGLIGVSGIGPAAVAVLILSGIVNGWFLVGPDHIGDLPASAWGQGLLLKLGLFLLMLLMAFANRNVLTPALAAGHSTGALKLSVLAETLLGLAMLATVASFGMQPPPVSG